MYVPCAPVARLRQPNNASAAMPAAKKGNVAGIGVGEKVGDQVPEPPPPVLAWLKIGRKIESPPVEDSTL
jgi:hypothetical protein